MKDLGNLFLMAVIYVIWKFIKSFLEDEGESAEEVDNLLNDRAEELCREWFLANVDEE